MALRAKRSRRIKGAEGRMSASGQSRPSHSAPVPTNVGYTFVSGDVALYVGVATMGLAKRLYFYRRPGPTQKTSIRVKALLLEALETFNKIAISTPIPPMVGGKGS